MQISNKISNLNKIKKNFNIPDYIVFSVRDFRINPEEVYKKCKKKFKDQLFQKKIQKVHLQENLLVCQIYILITRVIFLNL